MSAKKKKEEKKNISISPISLTADLTEPINKICDEVIIPTLNGAKFCINFLTSGIKPYMYKKIEESKYRIKEIDQKLAIKYNNIPDKNKIEPRISILGPAVDVLKYNLEEEHIRNMFINILVNEMDSRKQSNVLPAFTEIIKQLSKEDAEFLFKLNNYQRLPFSMIVVHSKYAVDSDSSKEIGKFLIIPQGRYQIDSFKLKDIIIDNLQRLQIIEIKKGLAITDENEIVDLTFNNDILKEFNEDKNKIFYKNSVFKITEFGKQFIDICCS